MIGRTVISLLVLTLAAGTPQRQAGQQDRTEAESTSQVPRIHFEAIVSSLIAPAKLDTLKGERAANARLRKIVYWLAFDRNQGGDHLG